VEAVLVHRDRALEVAVLDSVGIPLSLPKKVFVLGVKTGESRGEALWESLSRRTEVERIFVTDLLGPDFSGMERAFPEEVFTATWEEWHTVDDTCDRLADGLLEEHRAGRLGSNGVLMPDLPAVRRSLKHAGGISLTSERYERLAVTRADSERRLERASQRRTAEALRRFEREVLSTMERARKVSGCPVIGPDTPVAINKHGEAVLVGDPSAVTGPVGVALEAPQASLGYSFKMMPATSGPERMVSEAVARRAKDVLLQQIQDCIASGLIPESEALPPTLDTLDRPQDEDAVLPELAE
jgi:hypothetical protein